MGCITERLKGAVLDAVDERSPLVWIDGAREFESVAAGWKNDRTEFRYPFFMFEGSFLELMLAAREPLSKKNPVPCVIYLPGFTEEDVRDTPFLEACKSGRSWSTNLEKIVREAGEGVLRSDQIDYILSREGLDAATAESLASGMTARSPELEAALGKFGEDGLVIAFLEGSLDAPVSLAALREHFDRVFGCTDEWMNEWTEHADSASAREIAWALGAYLLCIEYACDLVASPPSERLAKLAGKDREYRARAVRILRILRQSKSELYVDLVEKTELGLRDTEHDIGADGLGNLDTFKFEAETMLDAALSALRSGDWARALKYAEPRLAEELSGESARTFWLKHDPARELIWRWVGVTAKLGKEIRNSGEALPSSFRAAYESYISGEWKIDSYHREYRIITNSINTQNFFPDTADYFSIRQAVNVLYRSWADGRARNWNRLCAQEHFAVSAEVGQRGFFARAVEPHLKAGRKTALMLVDALRYELGEELASLLSGYSNGTKIITPMLAELPTITAVGMNALMPAVRDGLLEPVFDKGAKRILGFRTGERQIVDPASRRTALAEYAAGRCEWTDLGEFLDATDKNLKRLTSANLLVIATQDIDSSGESGSGDFGIDFFQPVLARLKEAVEKLRANGFERIIITADHGFLIGDETVENGIAARLEKAERRHAFDQFRTGERLVSATFADLCWKSDDRDTALVLETGTHLLTSAKPKTFYHGGNSPQERVIPVIVLTGGASPEAREEKYRLKLAAYPSVFGVCRISVLVECASAGELFGPDRVELRLAADPGFRMTIGDAGGSRFTGDTIECAIGAETIISFRISSVSGGKSRVTVSQVASAPFIDSETTVEYYEAEAVSASAEVTGAQQKFVFPRDHIPEEFETAIMHLFQHGKLSESFLRNTLGGTPAASRKARRFAVEIENWKAYLPFSVTIHQTADGNEYRKI